MNANGSIPRIQYFPEFCNYQKKIEQQNSLTNTHNHLDSMAYNSTNCLFLTWEVFESLTMIFRIIIMPYKSTNKINTSIHCLSLPILLLMMLFLLPVTAQSQCAKRPFPPNISLKSNESIIINLDDYFDGSNLTFKVSPNNSFSAIQPTYQCTAAGSQRTGKVISSRYFLLGSEEVIAALSESPFIEGSFSFYVLQLKLGRMTTLNLPKENIALCNNFVIKMINSTHFAPAIHCTYTAKKYTYAILSAVAQLGSPYADWEIKLVPLFVEAYPTVRMELVDDTLVRGVFTPINSYIELWIWNEEVHQLEFMADRTVLLVKSFSLKSLKVYGRILIALDYQSGLHIFQILPTRKLDLIARVPFPFYDDFEYNTLTGTLFLSKKGKVVSTILYPNNHTLAVIGEGFNLYRYENIKKMLITDTSIVALGETSINIFRRTGAASDTRRYNIYQTTNAHMIYTRLISESFTVLLLQNAGINLQISSCRIRSPTLKLVTPRNSVQTVVTSTSTLDRQESVCSLSFMFQPDISKFDDIYDSGYRVDNEVVYANQQGQGSIDLGKYGLARDLEYVMKTIGNSIVQNQSRIKKSLPLMCTFEDVPIDAGKEISLLYSWENIILVQFSVDHAIRYYVCHLTKCTYSFTYTHFSQITHLSHETLQKTKNSSLILEALVYQKDGTVIVTARKLIVDNGGNTISFQSFCELSFSTSDHELWNITQVQIYNSFLYLVMPYKKEIRIYDLREEGHCLNVLNLNIQTCPWGYFAPQSIHFNRAMKGSFFSQNFLIRQWDEILTVRLEHLFNLQPVLITRNTIMLVTNYMLIYSAPYLLAFDVAADRTYTYYFDDQNIIQYLREIPMRDLRFKPSMKGRRDFARLIEARHLVLTMDDELTLAKVARIFKIDQLISAAIEYQSYTVKDGELITWLLVEDEWHPLRLTLAANGSSLIKCNGNITYLNPSIQLLFGRPPSSFQEYSQNVTLTLYTADKSKQHTFKVTLSNVGDAIKRGLGFPSRGSSFDAKPAFTIDDKRWFSGSVFEYEFDCPDCGDRILIKQKVNLEDREPLPVPANEFWMQGDEGKVVKVVMGSFLVELQYNHSVWPIEPTPANNTHYQLSQTISMTVNGGNCLQGIPSGRGRDNQIVALCERVFDDDSKLYYLSLISTASYKGFVVAQIFLFFPPQEQPKLISKNSIVIVYTSSIAYILTLWEVEQQLQFIQLDTIDREDIAGTICSVDLTYNSTIETSPLTQILFSLVVTECSSNAYFTSFLIYQEKEEYQDQQGKRKATIVPNLHVSSAQNINLIAKFAQNHIQIPSEATVIQTIAARPTTDSISILAVYDKFHSFQFLLTVSPAGVAYAIIISKVYYKYGNYEATSAERGDYLAIKYKSRLLGREERYGFFDSGVAANETKEMKEHYMFSGYSLQNSGVDRQEIPWLIKGKTVIHFNGDILEVLSIDNVLRGYIKRLGPQGQIPENDILYTQKLQITANNIASARSAVIIIKAVDKIQLTAWQIVLIVLGSIVAVVGGFFGVRFAVKSYRKHRKMVPLLEETTLEQAVLEEEEEERMSGRINLSIRGSVQPQDP